MSPRDVDLTDRDPRRPAARKGERRKKKAAGGGPSLGGRLLRLAIGLLVMGTVCGAAALAGLFLYYGNDPKLPAITSLSDYHPPQVIRVLDRQGRVISEVGTEKRTVVPYAQIPADLIHAIVSAEDAEFFKHEGISYRGIARAFFENLRHAHLSGPGGSTITQQVVKLLLLSPEKTIRRKVQEWILARRLDQKLSKQEILTIYLNQVNFGHGRYGCEEAARFYFGRGVAQIDTAQAALLAGLPQIPSHLSPREHGAAAKKRQSYVLDRMAENGYISRGVADRLIADPIQIVADPTAQLATAPEAADYVNHYLIDTLGPEKVAVIGGAVKTTLDLRLQQTARQALERGLEDLDLRQGYRGASGHLTGKALDRHRALLLSARKSSASGVLKDSEIVEGLVVRVEKDPRVSSLGKIWVDVGGVVGLVDLAFEGRYAGGKKPLVERLFPGDLLRVRAAPERRRPSGAGKDPAKEVLPLALELGPQAAMVVMNPQTREILALVGGYGFRAGGFDRSRRAQRQPGSAFKPFLYAAAIDSHRYTAASLVNDAPEVYELWKPENYEKGQFRGPVRLRLALAESINTVAIKLMSDLGLPAVREMAMKIGITSPIPDSLGLSLALGTLSVSPWQLANAYATFASGGRLSDPRLVLTVGEPTEPAPLITQALAPDTAFIMVSLLRSVVEEGTARAAAARLHRPAAGKTGTTNDSKDAWFVGFTPDLLAAVWVGFDDGKKLGRGEVGGKTAVPIWTDFMVKALADQPVRDFAQPAGVLVARIDPRTGLLPPPGGEGIDEVFLPGTVPTETAPSPGEGDNAADKLLLEGAP